MNTVSKSLGAVRAVLRVVRKIVVWGLLSLLTLLLVAFAINAIDERPSSETLALLHPPANPYGPDQNIYLALMGFDAPPGQSVILVGQRRIAEYNAQLDSMLKDPLLGMERLTREDPLRLQQVGSVDFCRMQDPSVWEVIRANASNIQSLIEQNRELYQRYVALLDMPGYYETALPSPVTPIPYGAPAQARKLFLAAMSLQLQSGDAGQTQVALGLLRQDVGLWHRVLAGQGAMISKMVALAYLQTDSLILADMIADPRASIPADVDAYFAQFESGDWDFGNAFQAEFRVDDFLYRQVQATALNDWQPPDTPRATRMWNSLLNPIEQHFFKIHATENLRAKQLNQLAGFARFTPTTFAVDQIGLKSWEQENTDLASIRTLYNPVGKILVAIAAPGYRYYVFRPYDTAAVQRLVRLSLEIRRQKVVPTAIADFMKQHPEWSTHPADGRPFVWNPAKMEIAIQPVAKQSTDRRFSAHIWKQPGN